jgi:hypothetical protein
MAIGLKQGIKMVLRAKTMLAAGCIKKVLIIRLATRTQNQLIILNYRTPWNS